MVRMMMMMVMIMIMKTKIAMINVRDSVMRNNYSALEIVLTPRFRSPFIHSGKYTAPCALCARSLIERQVDACISG